MIVTCLLRSLGYTFSVCFGHCLEAICTYRATVKFTVRRNNKTVLNMSSLKFISKLGEGRRRPFLLVLVLLASFLVLLALKGRDNVQDVLSKGGTWRKPIGTSTSSLKSLYPSHIKSLGNSTLGVRIPSRWYRCMKHTLTLQSVRKSLCRELARAIR